MEGCTRCSSSASRCITFGTATVPAVRRGVSCGRLARAHLGGVSVHLDGVCRKLQTRLARGGVWEFRGGGLLSGCKHTRVDPPWCGQARQRRGVRQRALAQQEAVFQLLRALRHLQGPGSTPPRARAAGVFAGDVAAFARSTSVGVASCEQSEACCTKRWCCCEGIQGKLASQTREQAQAGPLMDRAR